jgi:hypothetical protein
MAFSSISTDTITHRRPRRSKLNIVELLTAEVFGRLIALYGSLKHLS